MKTAGIFVLTLCIVSSALAATGASIDESAVTQIVYVDVNAGTGSGDGTQGAPFGTLGAGVEAALALKKAGTGVKVLVAPGTYREGEILIERCEGDAPLVIEAQEPGTAILSGSELYSDWNETAGYITHTWPHDWGNNPHQWGNRGAPLGEDIAPRSEMIFVDDSLLTPYISRQELVDGSFYVDESINMLFVDPPAGVDMNSAKVEVTVRHSNGITIERASNIIVRGLVIQHYGVMIGHSDATVYVDWSENILLDRVQVYHSSFTGIKIRNTANVSILNVTNSRNGGGGAEVTKVSNFLVDGYFSDWNNWRGNRVNFYGYAIAAMKVVFNIRDATFRNFRAFNNHTYGLWFDVGCEDIVVEDCQFNNNFVGLDIELSVGPFLVRDCDMKGNREVGLRIMSASHGVVENCRMVDNLVQINHIADGRTITGAGGATPTTGEDRPYCYDWTIRNCTVVSKEDPHVMEKQSHMHHWTGWTRRPDKTTPDPDDRNPFAEHQLLWLHGVSYKTDVDTWAKFLGTYKGENNVYCAPAGIDTAFIGTDTAPCTYDEWVSQTTEENGSMHNDCDGLVGAQQASRPAVSRSVGSRPAQRRFISIASQTDITAPPRAVRADIYSADGRTVASVDLRGDNAGKLSRILNRTAGISVVRYK